MHDDKSPFVESESTTAPPDAGQIIFLMTSPDAATNASAILGSCRVRTRGRRYKVLEPAFRCRRTASRNTKRWRQRITEARVRAGPQTGTGATSVGVEVSFGSSVHEYVAIAAPLGSQGPWPSWFMRRRGSTGGSLLSLSSLLSPSRRVLWWSESGWVRGSQGASQVWRVSASAANRSRRRCVRAPSSLQRLRLA